MAPLAPPPGYAYDTSIFKVTFFQGCKVIGCCESEIKVNYAKSIGYDAVINYKTDKPWSEHIKKCAKRGINCYFDNVRWYVGRQVLK